MKNTDSNMQQVQDEMSSVVKMNKFSRPSKFAIYFKSAKTDILKKLSQHEIEAIS